MTNRAKAKGEERGCREEGEGAEGVAGVTNLVETVFGNVRKWCCDSFILQTCFVDLVFSSVVREMTRLPEIRADQRKLGRRLVS